MKKSVTLLASVLCIVLALAAPMSFAGQEILIPYALTDDDWATGLAITNLSDEEISQLAVDFYPADGSFDVSRDRAVIGTIGPRAMIVDQARNIYPGQNLPSEQYSIRIFHDGDQPFGAAIFVLNFAQGFGLQQFRSEEFTSLDGDGSSLMVIHASPDAPAVDVRVDAFTAATGLTYPNNTSYLSVQEGNRFVEILVSGTETSVFQGTLTLEAETSYSAFAVNEAANLEVLVLEDDLTPPASGSAHVRFIHLSPDAPAVDVTLDDGTPVFTNYNFKDASAFTPVEAGPVDLQVRAAGTETVVLDIPEIQLTDGVIYTIFARGFVEGTGKQALGYKIIENN